jgi:copper resistance protein D
MSPLGLARFALYADLGLVFGLPAAAILTRAPAIGPGLRRTVVAAALAGLPLSIIAYLMTIAGMAGTGISGLTADLVRELTAGTALGAAFIVRCAALALTAVLSWRGRPGSRWPVLAGGAALVSLAWSGHAAAGEGALAWPRLAIDAVHLLAAAAWVGALVLFLGMLRTSPAPPDGSGAALVRFARMGSGLVALLAATGLTNLWFLAPLRDWLALLGAPYGQLLLFKLGLFTAMLTIAALNRFSLVPAMIAQGSAARDVRRLRRSITLECGAALGILLIVARLGLMNPAGG